MIKFEKPQNLNGQELREQLRNQGILISDDKDSVLIDSNGDFFLDIDLKDKSKAASIVATHNGTIIAPEPSIAEKLSSVGLNIEDLKIALGVE